MNLLRLGEKYHQGKIYQNKASLINDKFNQVDRVLDVGFFGQGINIDHASWGHRLIKKQVNYLLGIDVSIDPAKIKGLDLNYEIKDAERFDYDQSFSIVYAGDLIEHLSNPGLFLESAKRSLSPTGKLILTTPNTFNLFNIVDKLFHWEPTVNSEHVAYFNIKTLNTLLQRHGLEIEEVAFIYSLEIDFKRSLWKHIQDCIYYFLSKWTNKYSETLVIVAQALPNQSEK